VELSEAEFPLRLRRAGLVNLGRTSVPEFGILGTTETLAEGPTCTPWSAEHMAGGSSGGAAAVVGAGIVPVAAASDGGGSIRIPASACGVVGLKTSRGRVPWGPHISEALLGWAVHFMVSRTVRDTAALLDVCAGPMPGDPFEIAGSPGSYLAGLSEPTGPLRIAVSVEPFAGKAPDPQVVAATRATAQLLADLGHEVVEATPRFPWEPFLQTMTDIWSATTAHTVDGFARAVGRAVNADTVEMPTLTMVEYGREVTAQQVLDGMGVINGVARVMGDFFSHHDLLLTATLGALPARLGQYDPHAAQPPRELFDSWSHLESFLPVFNATGQPAISLPLHQSAEGLPIGMQLVGRFGAEALLLRVAAQLEEALPWAQRRPPIHVAA
jgi:amidase